jgi:hypothetical protein
MLPPLVGLKRGDALQQAPSSRGNIQMVTGEFSKGTLGKYPFRQTYLGGVALKSLPTNNDQHPGPGSDVGQGDAADPHG